MWPVVKRGDGPQFGGRHHGGASARRFNLNASRNGDFIVERIEGANAHVQAFKLLHGVGGEVDIEACNDALRSDGDFSRGNRPADGVLQRVNTRNLCVVGIGAFRGRDHAQGWDGFSIFGPVHVLRELVAVGVRTRDLDVNALTRCWGTQRHVCTDGDRLAVNHRDGDAVAHVEAGSADLIRLNAPFTHHGGFPAHAVEQKLGGDVLDIAGGDVDLHPGETVRSDSVVVGVVEVREEVDSVIRGQLEHGTGASVRVVCRALDADRVQETVVDGHVDAHCMDGGTVIVGGRQGVGVFTCKVRREGCCVAAQDLKEVRGITHGWVVKCPVHDDGPLVALGVDGEHVGIERIIGCQVEMRPRRINVVYLDAQGLNHSLRDVDGDLRQRGFVSSLQNLRTGLHRVPDGRGSRRQLSVGGLGPVVGWEDHRQAVASNVNPGGVDVHSVVRRDGSGRYVQFEVGDGTVANRDVHFSRNTCNRGHGEAPHTDVVGVVLLVDLRVVAVGG